MSEACYLRPMSPLEELADAIGESRFFVAMFISRIATKLGVDKQTLALRLLNVVKEMKS